MRSNATRMIAAAALYCAACGGSGAEEEPGFPTRDWSGPYAVQVDDATTDCVGADAPPPLEDLVLEIDQSVENEAVVRVGPLIALGGRFDGDELEAVGTISEPVSLPDSMLARATAADSLETITYELRATFEGEGAFRGTYRIAAPDLVALARGTGDFRCEYVYEVRGTSPVTAPVEVLQEEAAGRR